MLHKLVQPGGNIESMELPIEYLNFTRMSFDIAPVILLSP